MISEAVHLEYIVTPSEADALILENSFIKQLKTKNTTSCFVTTMTYPYIFINLNDEFPRFEITRKVVKGSNIRYFGPYFSGAGELLEALYLNFNLVQKNPASKAKKPAFSPAKTLLRPMWEQNLKRELRQNSRWCHSRFTKSKFVNRSPWRAHAKLCQGRRLRASSRD